MYKKGSHRVGFALSPEEYNYILVVKERNNLRSVASAFHYLLDVYINPRLDFSLLPSDFDSGITVRSVEHRFDVRKFFSSIFHKGKK